MKSNFIDWLREKEITEAVKDKQFKIVINDEEYTVIRDKHLTQKRNGVPKPKDFNMSKQKYEVALQNLDKINIKEPFSFTWRVNNKSNIISASIKDKTITIFGAIMNSDKPEEKLYSDVTNRASIQAPK